MERYVKYQDSEISWIGKIPEDWDLVKTKNLFEIRKRIVGYDGPPVLSITQNGIIEKDLASGEGQLASSYSNYQWVHPGDFAMNHMDLLTGWVDCSKFEGVTSPDYRVFSPIQEIDRAYFTYVLQHCYSARVFYGYGQGVSNYGRWRLPANAFKEFVLPVPPLSVQKGIAAYLDAKTAEIDELIEQNERSIELLEEYRKSVISEVVTKGLDPDVPMKDSGIEWVDKIPKHWNIMPLKRLFSFGRGLLITKESLVEDGLPVVSYGQIHSKVNKVTYIDPAMIRYVPFENESKKESWVNVDDFLVADTSEDIEGSGNFVRVDIEGGLFAGYHTIVLRALKPEYSHYFSYLMQTDAWRSQVRKRVNGVKLFSLTKRILASTTLILPDSEECNEISRRLDSITNAIDEAVKMKRTYTDKLREYRKSLISEAVTGKIKVPGVE